MSDAAQKGKGAITGGFGITMDLERGASRQWYVGRDGVKRWADSEGRNDESS